MRKTALRYGDGWVGVESRHAASSGLIVLISACGTLRKLRIRSLHDISLPQRQGRAGRRRVNAIAPGYVQTEFITMLSARGILDAERFARRIPMEPHRDT